MSKFYICVSKISSTAIRLLTHEITDTVYFLLLCYIHPAG